MVIWAQIVDVGRNTAALSSISELDLTWQPLVIETICREQSKKFTLGSGSAVIDDAEGVVLFPLHLQDLGPP
jgi:hypothetical protein